MSVIGSNALAGASGQAGGSGYTVERSLRFNDDDTAYLNKTPSGQGSRTTFTFSCWAKRSTLAAYPVIFSAGSSSVSLGYFQLSFEIGPMMAYIRHGGGTWAFTTNAKFRDTASWYSIILSVDSSANNASDRLKLYINGVQQTFTSSPTITQDFNFEVNSTIEHHIGAGKNSAGQTSVYYDGYLADVQFIDGSALSASDLGEFNSDGVWVPIKYAGTYGTRGYHLDFADGNDIGNDAAGSNNWTVNNLTATGGTVNYINSISGNPYIPSNAFSTSYISTYVNTSTWAITNAAWAGVWDSSGNTNVFTPSGGIAVSSSLIVYYGNYNNAASTTTLTITYTDSSTETDTFTSGNNNWMGSFTASNAAGKTIQSIQVVGPSSAAYQSFGGFVIDGQILTSANPDTDVLRDSPTNGDATADTGAGGEVSGNYCTWSPLAGTNVTLSNGNLDCSLSAGTASKARATIAVTSGKYYWEITFKSGQYGMIGISDASLAGSQISYAAGGLYYYVQTGGLYGDVGGSFSNTSYGSALSANDVLGVALDMDNGNVKFYKNGSDLGNANTSSLVGKTIMPHLGEAGGATFVTEANFGARSFTYSAPSGYKALCTANLPTPTIANSSEYFEAKTFDGNNGTQTISGFEFSPDMIWCKSRSNAYNHQIWDRVRGDNEVLRPSTADAEQYYNGSLVFTSDGFTSTTNNNANYVPAGAGSASIAWAWDAGANSSKTFTVKVVSDSGNKYRFDDFGTSAVTLDLEEGSTYVFDQSDSSNSGHPLRFSTTSDGTHGSGTEYTTGVTTTGTPGSAGAKTTIVVASGAPTLYYYCSVHSGMGGQANTNSTAGASNFDGSIQSTVRANQTAGFSIVKWNPSSNGQSVGHGLNAVPEFIMAKALDNGHSWRVYHKSLTSGKNLLLDSYSSEDTYSADIDTVSSTVFNGGQGLTGSSLNNNIAYCFTPVAGYSAFGSYVGNSSDNGPFVYTGFRPSWLLIKVTGAANDWVIHDNKRDAFNPSDSVLKPNSSGTEDTSSSNYVDFLSNGFKIRNSQSKWNAGYTYIYAAFAENPFQANGGLAR